MNSALIGLVGIVVGAALQSIASLWLSKRQRIRAEQLEAYKAFVAVVTRNFDDSLFVSRKILRDDALRQACIGIGIFGSPEVILAVSQLIEGDGPDYNYFDSLRLLEVVRAMRRDLSGFSDQGIQSDIFLMVIAGTRDTGRLMESSEAKEDE